MERFSIEVEHGITFCNKCPYKHLEGYPNRCSDFFRAIGLPCSTYNLSTMKMTKENKSSPINPALYDALYGKNTE